MDLYIKLVLQQGESRILLYSDRNRVQEKIMEAMKIKEQSLEEFEESLMMFYFGFWSMQAHLAAEKVRFHTFSLQAEREVKVTIWGLHHDTDSAEISAELQQEDFSPTHVQMLNRQAGRGNKVPNNTFLVKLARTRKNCCL